MILADESSTTTFDIRFAQEPQSSVIANPHDVVDPTNYSHPESIGNHDSPSVGESVSGQQSSGISDVSVNITPTPVHSPSSSSHDPNTDSDGDIAPPVEGLVKTRYGRISKPPDFYTPTNFIGMTSRFD